ncbi:MAG: hypothetical protein ACRD18_01790 [Terriglobia bacterium]
MNFLKKKALVRIGLGMALALAFGISVQASNVTVNGSAWINDSTGAQDAVIGNVPSSTPDVTFTVNTSTSLQFSSYFGAGSCGITCGNGGLSYTVGSFLANGNPAATILTGSSSALANTLDNTIFEFTATVPITTGETFLVGHDDGASFYVDGNIIPGISPAGTSYVLTPITYTGPNDPSASLVMVYGEAFGAPAVFATNLPTGGGPTLTPEPSAFLLWGTGLGLLGLMLVSRRRKLFVS